MRPLRLALPFLCALLLAPAACGGDDDDDDDDDDGGAAVDAAPGSDTDASPGDDAATSDGGNTGAQCGGLLGLQCDGDDYCDWEDDSCGNSDFQGTCRPRPAECEPGGEKVCGCDGESYENKCEAAQAGMDVAEISIC
jgi:hypothetical protein